ncbi:hypothetical protein [Paludisphaera mucosa]|uniref:Uncharacterized protein n=1 Tax=Paludisphaera mucosa TaxID=3030827 RepID=A0ABT6FD76_9BACT|nr:hypothetical protein [Paludisphaera mucosa]MDG3005492.1 hypothetical protein [Paludisphaera mucosa]
MARPRVVQHRSHRLTCPGSGASSYGTAPVGTEVSYGPQAQSATAVLAGEGRISKRHLARVMRSLFGLPIGPPAACDLERRTADAPAPLHAEALEHVHALPANVDDTG